MITTGKTFKLKRGEGREAALKRSRQEAQDESIKRSEAARSLETRQVQVPQPLLSRDQQTPSTGLARPERATQLESRIEQRLDRESLIEGAQRFGAPLQTTGFISSVTQPTVPAETFGQRVASTFQESSRGRFAPTGIGDALL